MAKIILNNSTDSWAWKVRNYLFLIYGMINKSFSERGRKQTSLSGIKTASHKSIDRGCGCIDKYCRTQDGATPAINKKQVSIQYNYMYVKKLCCVYMGKYIFSIKPTEMKKKYALHKLIQCIWQCTCRDIKRLTRCRGLPWWWRRWHRQPQKISDILYRSG